MCKCRSNYRKICRIKKKNLEIKRARELAKLSKEKSRQFWKIVKRKKKQVP